MPEPNATVHVLAIMAHPDDAELLCGGTLARAAEQGYRTGILDLTGGEIGSYGTRDIRAAEAQRAAVILGLATRRNAGLTDGALVNTPETRATVASLLRELRPEIVLLHGAGARHPDHGAARRLARDACFIAGLRNAPLAGEPHRPRKILYCQSFLEPAGKPTFVVDISEQMDRKIEAITAYASQFTGRTSAGDLFGGGHRDFLDQIRAHAAHYGSFIRRPYGEPFRTRETMLVDDVLALQVNSM